MPPQLRMPLLRLTPEQLGQPLPAAEPVALSAPVRSSSAVPQVAPILTIDLAVGRVTHDVHHDAHHDLHHEVHHEPRRRSRVEAAAQVAAPAVAAGLLPDGLARWTVTVRDADEAAVLVDDDGRLLAMSCRADTLLMLGPAQIGNRLVELLDVVDSTASALSLNDASGTLPPLRVLRGGVQLARSLVRLRRSDDADGIVVLDVVGVAVAGGALGFLTEI